MTCSNLGALPGGINSFAVSLDAHGDVVGTAENGETDPLLGFPESHPVLWKHGMAIDLGTFGGYNGLAFAINNRDEVVGFAQNNISDPFGYFGFAGQSRAFLWKRGVLRDLGTLAEGNDAFAMFVSGRSQVAGISFTESIATTNCGFLNLPFPANGNVPTLHPFLWENGTMVDLGTLGGDCAAPAAINNRGQVAGNSNVADPNANPHAFLWSPETGIKDLGTLGGTFAQANDLNDAGVVVGASNTQNDETFHAYLRRNGSLMDLGTLPGDFCSIAYAINSAGQIVGDSLPFPCDFSIIHPFLWENGQIISLQAFVPQAPGVTLGEPAGINDQGEIALGGLDADGNNHAFLLTPCPTDDAVCTDATANKSGIGVTPSPAMQGALAVNQRSTIRQLLQHRLGIGRPIASPQKLELPGAALISGPNATLSPTSLYFRCRNVINAGCQCITQRTTTLSNLGNATLDIKSISTTGAFTQTNNCGATLAAGKSCSISVHWSLVNSGGDVYVSDNAPYSPQKVSLSGIKECTP
jgi:probable HAF family extracellular repeat protein